MTNATASDGGKSGERRKFKFPTAYTILFLLIVVVGILTWFLPTGGYDYRSDSGQIVRASEVADYGGGESLTPIPGSYTHLKSNPQGIGAMLLAPIGGVYDGIAVSLFVLMVGGCLGVVKETRSIDKGISLVVRRLDKKVGLLIPILMFLFSVGGTTYGMAEESIAFYPILIPIMLMAGYDTLTAVSIILLGAGIGVMGSTVNPFATGIASNFADVPLGQGMGIRAAMWIVGVIICCLYVLRYAKRVKADPSLSLVAGRMEEDRNYFLGSAEGAAEDAALSGVQKVTLCLFALVFVVMIWGVIPFADLGVHAIPTLNWGFSELSVLFMVGAIVIGLVNGMEEEKLVSAFIGGAEELLGVALIIGIARGITIIMKNGLIIGTILHMGEYLIKGLPSCIFANMVYFIHIVLSFLIPSSSGLATVSMPIFAPLAVFAHIGKDVVVTAYQSASGIVNLFTPTSAVVMGALGLGRVSYGTWLRFVMPLALILLVMTVVFLTIAAI